MPEILKTMEKLYNECFNDVKKIFNNIDDETCHKITYSIMAISINKVFNF